MKNWGGGAHNSQWQHGNPISFPVLEEKGNSWWYCCPICFSWLCLEESHFLPLTKRKKSVFLLVKCLFNVWHASLVQWGVLCKSSEYSDNNKPHLTFCLLDTGCSHTVYRSEELLSQQFLGTDISLFTSFTVSFDWWKSSGHFLVPCVDIGGHTQQMKQISVLFLQRSYNYLNTSVSLKWSGLLCCSVWKTVLCQVPPLLLLL